MDLSENKIRRINSITIIISFSLALLSLTTLYVWLAGISFLNSPIFVRKAQEVYTEDSLHPLSEEKINLQIEENARIEAERLLEMELQDRIRRVEAFFDSYGSIMKGYGEIIVRQANACGGDWRVLVGIAGNESGLGRIPYKLYNPYGYLDGMQYSGWQESLTKLSCTISQRFIRPCNADLYCIINRYGGPDTDKPRWVSNVSWFMNQL